MAFSSQDSKLVKQLIAVGVIPKQCTRFELVMEVNQPIRIRMEVYASPEDTERIAEALEAHPDEVAEMVQQTVFHIIGT